MSRSSEMAMKLQSGKVEQYLHKYSMQNQQLMCIVYSFIRASKTISPAYKLYIKKLKLNQWTIGMDGAYNRCDNRLTSKVALVDHHFLCKEYLLN